jgi:hypothetical protein
VAYSVAVDEDECVLVCGAQDGQSFLEVNNCRTYRLFYLAVYLAGLSLWSFIREVSWRGVAAVLVEFSNALEETSTIGDGDFGTKCRGTFEVEDTERGEVVLN